MLGISRLGNAASERRVSESSSSAAAATMPDSVKLTYFNIRGRAEFARLVLAQAAVEYEDVRVEGEKWKAMKEGEDRD